MRVKVQLPRTLEEGLAGQSPIKYPMLFEFPGKPTFRTMWMHGMLEPIDIVWLDETKSIVGIHHNCPPGDTHTYSSGTFVKYAIEFPAGYAKQHKLAAGDMFDFDSKK